MDAADGRLEVEADEGQDLGDRRAVVHERVLRSAPEGGKAEEPGVVAEVAGGPGLVDGLPGAADEARDHRKRTLAPGPGGVHGESQHRRVETGLADGELGAVHPDRESARPGVDVVAGQGRLVAFVEVPPGGEGERMGRNDRAPAQHGQDVVRNGVVTDL